MGRFKNVSPSVLFRWMSESMDELLGTASDSVYESRHLSLRRGELHTRPDFLPFWSALQDRSYLHWQWSGSEYYLFDNGVLLQTRSYRGRIEAATEDEVEEIIRSILNRCVEELGSIVVTSKFTAALDKAGVTNQAAFIEYYMSRRDAKDGDILQIAHD